MVMERNEGRHFHPQSHVQTSPERVLKTCPNCGAELIDRKCKLLCLTPGCGYFLSCSDFD
jgi:hypothetical protein